MFCGKCGTKNADNAKFCANCGAQLGNRVPVNTASVSMSGQNDKNRMIGMIAAGVIVVLVVIFAIFLFGGRSYKSTIKKYVDAQFDTDAEAIFDLMPDKMIDYMLDEEVYDSDDLDDLIDEADEALQDFMDYLDSYIGEDWKVSYEIIDTEDIKGDDLDDIQDAYEDAGVKVTAAKKVELEITLSSDETISASLEIPLIKIGRTWYLDAVNMGTLF